MQLKVFLAGRFTLECDGAPIEEARLPARQGRLLFAYLASEPGRLAPRDELAEALWGERPPPTWEKALTVVASKLRAALAEGHLDRIAKLTGAFGCYRLDLTDGAWVDVVAAAEAADEAEDALAAAELEAARSAGVLAASLARHPFLPGEDGAWVAKKRRDLDDIRARALVVVAEAHLRAGAAAEAATWFEQAIALAPFRETGYRRLMEAHIAAGEPKRCRYITAAVGCWPMSSGPTPLRRRSPSTANCSSRFRSSMETRPRRSRSPRFRPRPERQVGRAGDDS